MFRNKFNLTMLAVVLIALLCFFLPDVKAQQSIEPYLKPLSQNEALKIDIAEIITSLYSDYAKECYKDSTLSHTYMPKWNSGCLRQTGNLADGYSFVIGCKDSSHYSYTHRTPTFEGFIEFLRRRGAKSN